MNNARRNKIAIYGDLLSALSHETKNEKIVLTHVQEQINVPLDRLKNYISELNNLGLVQNEMDPKLTEKGQEFLMECEKIIDFMKRMGLSYR